MPLPLILPARRPVYVDASPEVHQAPNGPAGPSVTFSVPADPALACFKGYAQFATIDTINAPNVVLSDALELTILP